MIHTVHTMTIRKYGEIDRTGDLSLLKRWYNPFPIRWFNTELFFDEFKSIFNDNINTDAIDNVHRLLSYNKLILIDTLIKTLYVLMADINDRNLFALIFKRKEINHKNIDIYCAKLSNLTGVKVKNH